MTSLLITNDDGIDAPALVPLATALGRLGQVTVAAPSGERSWIGKAITRVGTVQATAVERGGIEMWSVDGFPADCVHVGSFGILESPPDLVVSGINIGSNKGSAFATGSGTLGATVEASNVGLGGVAFSAMSVGVWDEWVRWVYTEPAVEMWTRLADIATDMVATILETGFPPNVDVLSVNIPADADQATARRVTSLARTKYGALFAGNNGIYRHSFDGMLHIEGDVDGSDLQALDEGHISITPIRYANTAHVGDSLRERWES
ncbi:MAG: 5'/3'-nucleotidase SurE [Acidimicrobiia bacterium]|nr:5'/3'-nucleotidase SurE [Acidimicrobiia bacterium]